MHTWISDLLLFIIITFGYARTRLSGEETYARRFVFGGQKQKEALQIGKMLGFLRLL